jgi:hypothetical protein
VDHHPHRVNRGHLALRYLSPVRVGPAIATAAGAGGLYHVAVRDADADDRLAVLATARTF